MVNKILPPALNKQGKIDMRKASHDWKIGYPKLSTELITEMIQRYQIGATQKELSDAFGVTTQTIRKHLKRADVLRPASMYKNKKEFRENPKKKVREFFKEASSILWRMDGPSKDRYTAWRALIVSLIEDTECSWEDAVVQASRSQKCLRNLIRQYKLWEFTLLHATKVELEMVQQEIIKEKTREIVEKEKNRDIQTQTSSSQITDAQTHTVLTVSDSKITCTNTEQPFRENLAWAIQAAGLLLRTGEKPKECPNDSAFFLYSQACDDPKGFLGRFAQIEGKSVEDKEDNELQKATKRSVAEIEEQLQMLKKEDVIEYKQEFINKELEE
ncbi:hypothetical protein LCGC14_2775680 [marine sediment metagenome]|uniref:Uncharacterized protein n=1 Tax=marine sediment metagenome TaxID=412755 RepID=A0A0F8ZGR3_9ZZZZ